MRILIPLDGSPQAEQALAPAVMLAQHLQPSAAIVLARVIRSPVMESGWASPYADTNSAGMLEDLAAEAQAYLHTTAQLPIFQGKAVSTTAQMGVPAPTICAIAHHKQIDLIIMTSHGRTGLGKLVLGSVAEDVIRDAHIPVLIVRDHGETFPDVGRFAPLTILVPLDGTVLCEAAIGPAATLARAFHGTLSLVRILPDTAKNDAVTAQQAYDYLTVLHDRLTREDITVHRSLGWGDPAEQIIAKAHEHRADIVAIATHGRTPLGQMLHGSIAATMLHQVSLPLLVVHPAQAGEATTITTQRSATAYNYD